MLSARLVARLSARGSGVDSEVRGLQVREMRPLRLEPRRPEDVALRAPWQREDGNDDDVDDDSTQAVGVCLGTLQSRTTVRWEDSP